MQGTFVISISDGYCEYAYPIKLNDRRTSVYTMAKRIFKAFKRPCPDPGYYRANGDVRALKAGKRVRLLKFDRKRVSC